MYNYIKAVTSIIGDQIKENSQFSGVKSNGNQKPGQALGLPQLLE